MLEEVTDGQQTTDDRQKMMDNRANHVSYAPVQPWLREAKLSGASAEKAEMSAWSRDDDADSYYYHVLSSHVDFFFSFFQQLKIDEEV